MVTKPKQEGHDMNAAPIDHPLGFDVPSAG